MRQTIIMVTGRNPLLSPSGDGSYIGAAGRAAIHAGYEPHIFCVGPSTRVEETPIGVVHCAKTPFRPIRTLMAAAHGPYIVRAVARFAAERGGTFLVHSFGSWSGVGGAAARRLARSGFQCTAVATAWSTYTHEARAKIKGVSGAHGISTKLALHWELIWTLMTVAPGERRALREAKLVLVNYDSVKSIITAECGAGVRFRKSAYASEAAFVRTAGCRPPIPNFVAHLEPKEAPLIVSVSSHNTRKGLDVLLRALGALRRDKRRFRACLVGGGPLLERHRRFAAELGLSSCAAIPGAIPDAYACLRHADIFVLPSIEEGSGSMSLLEAMQAGAAPVVSRVDGLPEDVAEGDSALMAEPGDDEGLARPLRRLIDDGALRRRLAQRAYEVYRQRFSAGAFSAGLREIYTGLGFPPSRRDVAGAEAASLK